MSKFKEIDNSLTSPNDSTNLKAGIDTVQKIYVTSSMKSQLIFLIDSLKENYEIVSEGSSRVKSTKDLRFDTKRLLLYVQKYNQLKKNSIDSPISDTIIYNTGLAKFNEQKWLSDYFESVAKEVSITYLNFLRNQLEKNN